jgi:hypothetical protein
MSGSHSGVQQRAVRADCGPDATHQPPALGSGRLTAVTEPHHPATPAATGPHHPATSAATGPHHPATSAAAATGPQHSTRAAAATEPQHSTTAAAVTGPQHPTTAADLHTVPAPVPLPAPGWFIFIAF